MKKQHLSLTELHFIIANAFFTLFYFKCFQNICRGEKGYFYAERGDVPFNPHTTCCKILKRTLKGD